MTNLVLGMWFGTLNVMSAVAIVELASPIAAFFIIVRLWGFFLEMGDNVDVFELLGSIWRPRPTLDTRSCRKSVVLTRLPFCFH